MTHSPLTDDNLLKLLGHLREQDSFVFLETTKVTSEDYCSYLFINPVTELICKGGDDPGAFFDKAESYLRKGFYLAGWFAYELGYLLEPKFNTDLHGSEGTPLAVLGVYKRPHIYDHRDGTFRGAGFWPTNQAYNEDNMPPYAIDDVRLNQSKKDYIQNIQRIKAYIESGDTYQVNYTLKYRFTFSGSPEALYRTLRRNQSVSYGAYIKTSTRSIMSLSPELFFEKQGRKCIVRPMKGTIKRGRTSEEDRELSDFLKSDIKNRSENIMIVDLLRNDLGRLCEMGSVKGMSLFNVEKYETLHQMTSTIGGTLGPKISISDLFRAIFPSGSVTGAPKIRTMEIIRELESEQRGVYTGGIGFFSPDGSAKLNVPIRTVVLENDKGEMGIGSGIVYDSDAEKEWDECLLKGNFLTRPVPEFRLIETLLWKPEHGYWLLDEHLERLLNSANYFGFGASRDEIIASLQSCAEFFPTASHQRVRLTLAKDGTLTCTSIACPPPAAISPDEFSSVAKSLPRIIISEKNADSQSPFLFHKTTQRQIYDTERERALQKGYFEVVFTNEKGEVTEGAITNIFIKKDNQLFTPHLACGLLNGVFRQYLLKKMGPDRIREKVLRLIDLKEADAIYLGNSVRGVVRVALEDSL